MSAKLPVLRSLTSFPERVLIIYITDRLCSVDNVQLWAQKERALLDDSITRIYVVNPFVDPPNPGECKEPSLEEVAW